MDSASQLVISKRTTTSFTMPTGSIYPSLRRVNCHGPRDTHKHAVWGRQRLFAEPEICRRGRRDCGGRDDFCVPCRYVDAHGQPTRDARRRAQRMRVGPEPSRVSRTCRRTPPMLRLTIPAIPVKCSRPAGARCPRRAAMSLRICMI